MNKSDTNRQGDIYGSFLSDGVEFAINAHELQEVVRYENEMPSVPLSPTYFLGLFSLRDSIIPVVDLRALFKSTGGEMGRESCIAILLVDGIRMGLLFDSTSEVLRIKDTQLKGFKYSGAGAESRSPVSGTISLDQGERMIQILDARYLVGLERLPLQKNDGVSQENAHRLRAKSKCITFYSSGIRYGFGIDAIREIISLPEIISSGINSKTCIGQAELRGTSLPVIDFSVLCNGSRSSELDQSSKRVVIANIGDQPVGFLVDRIDSIIEYFLDTMQLLPQFKNETGSYCLGCISDSSESDISMIDHKKLYAVPEVTAPVAAIADGNAYKRDRAAAEQAGQRSQTFLMVDVGLNFALPVSSIVEIIEMPEEIVPIALGPSYVKGMFNLRKTLVSIVDLRALYELEAAPAETKKKLLIVQSQGVYLALMVDSVLDIFSTKEGSVHKTPVAMLRSASEAFKEDALETIMHDSKVVLSLDFDSLISRVLSQAPIDQNLSEPLAKAA